MARLAPLLRVTLLGLYWMPRIFNEVSPLWLVGTGRISSPVWAQHFLTYRFQVIVLWRCLPSLMKFTLYQIAIHPNTQETSMQISGALSPCSFLLSGIFSPWILPQPLCTLISVFSVQCRSMWESSGSVIEDLPQAERLRNIGFILFVHSPALSVFSWKTVVSHVFPTLFYFFCFLLFNGRKASSTVVTKHSAFYTLFSL